MPLPVPRITQLRRVPVLEVSRKGVARLSFEVDEVTGGEGRRGPVPLVLPHSRV